MINVSLVDADTYQVVVERDPETTHVVHMSQEYYRQLCGAMVTHEWLLVQAFNFLLEREAVDREGNLQRIIAIDPPEYMTAILRATDIDLSRDEQQRYLFVVDLGSNRIWILERESGDLVGSIGGSGHMAGEFTFPHTLVTDSQGNLYAAETIGGRRNQKFLRVSD